jgi:hypothetical protein
MKNTIDPSLFTGREPGFAKVPYRKSSAVKNPAETPVFLMSGHIS